MPLVSVVIPTHNAAVYLPETLRSVLQQEFADFEVIVVDDCSTDHTSELLASIGDDRLRYVRLPEGHGGPSKPRNEGVKLARGEFVAFLDSDDIMSPGRLAAEVELMTSRPSIGMVFTNAVKFSDETGETLNVFLDGYEYFNGLAKERTLIPFAMVIGSRHAFEGLFFENYVLSGGVVVPKRVFEDIGLFDENLTNADDWDMWLRIARKYDVGYIDRIGFRYRVRRGSVSTRGVTLALNRRAVVIKQINAGLPDSLVEPSLHLLSLNERDAAFGYQAAEEFVKARHHYVKSFRAEWNLGALRGFLVTLLGPKLAARARRLRARTRACSLDRLNWPDGQTRRP